MCIRRPPSCHPLPAGTLSTCPHRSFSSPVHPATSAVGSSEEPTAKGRFTLPGARSTGSATAIAFDVADHDATLAAVGSLRPTVIIHTAAINPGQGDDDAMWRVNVTGSRNVAEAAVTQGARLVAVSTDVLHDGTAGPYANNASRRRSTPTVDRRPRAKPPSSRSIHQP